MEMSRQRLRPALSEGASIPCPRCGGSGHVRDTESSALQILRIIQEEANKDNTAAVHAQVPVEVASFLLNEKRTEIAKIEIKQRISVLLVPNKTLETPNYKLERLKHDDPRLDRMEASYKMAEEFEDPTAVTRRSQEPTNKQTPVIKGVLPDAPAPIVEPKPVAASKPAATAPAAAPVQPPASGGFFGWLKGLFGGGGDASSKVEAPVATPPSTGAGNKDDKRDGRGNNRRGGRRGESRGERGEGRTERSEGRAERGEGRGDRTPRGDRNGERGERGDRGQRPAREGQERRPLDSPSPTPVAEGAPEVVTEGTQANTPQENRRERGDGRRERAEGRRERAPRVDRPARDAVAAATGVAGDEVATQQAQATPLSEGNPDAQAPEGGERRERRSRDRYGRDRRGDRPGRESSGESTASYAADATPLVAESVPATATAPQGRQPLPKVQPYELPVSTLQAVAQAAQMEWVQSDPVRVAEVQAAIAAEPKPVHVPRERPPLVVLDEGPLILVETRKDLTELSMP
jgi:ribonuclease E